MTLRVRDVSLDYRWQQLDPSASRLVGPDYYVDAGPFVECVSDQLKPIHSHDYFELAWLAEGPVVLYHDFRYFPLETGALTIVLPRRMHTWVADWQTTRLVVIGIMPELMALVNNVAGSGAKFPFDDPSTCPYIQTCGANFEAIDRAINLLVWRCRTLGPKDQAVLVAHLELILSEATLAWRDVQVAARNRPINARGALTDAFRFQVEQHLRERLKVKEYAAILGVSPEHLIGTVTETTGISPKRIIDDRLVLEACRLLAHTHATIQEIAFSLSFNNASQFSRWFKTRKGMSPTQFREKWTQRQVFSILG
ncbi:MAG: helix-turn-helix transcriptional regulator [Anaerolineales bacterium]|nr:helix-turn-helix transcriptional regulator [Anaerolineales bacterium]